MKPRRGSTSHLSPSDVASLISRTLPIDEMMMAIEEIVTYDRYQASVGIEKAADFVASTAERWGLETVEIQHLPSDGQRHWWTFEAPKAWSPIKAELEILYGHSSEIVTSYPAQPCSLATYSSGTSQEGVIVPLVELCPNTKKSSLSDAIAIVPPNSLSFSETVNLLDDVGALGFAIGGSASGSDPLEDGFVRRLELSPTTKLFGFSVNHKVLENLILAARAGAWGHATVLIDRSASTPVVLATLPGESREEILLTSHLCHPAPGANDNASGVASLLGIGSTLATISRDGVWPGRRSAKFLWAPEFVGTAAYIHSCIEKGVEKLPICAINMDMVGEDQEICGGPMVLERSPDHVPSFLAAISEHCAHIVFQSRRSSVGGAESESDQDWRAIPFQGRSDHALFGDRMVARPTVAIGHLYDRFKHSSEDTIDKVSPTELRRASVIAGATALLVAVADKKRRLGLANIVGQWGARQLTRVCSLVTSEAATTATDVIDPVSRHVLPDYFEHTKQVVLSALDSVAPFDARANYWKHSLRRLATYISSGVYSRQEGKTLSYAYDNKPLRRLWEGPFNLKGLASEAPISSKRWLDSSLDRNHYAYNWMIALALSIDGQSSRSDVLKRAAISSQQVIEIDFSLKFLDLLIRTGWVYEDD